MLELTTLKFATDTKGLDEVIGKLKTIKEEISSIKPIRDPLTPTNKPGSGGGGGVNTSGVDKVKKAIDLRTESLKILRGQEVQAADGLVRLGEGFTRMQSNQLANLKAMGATTDQLMQMVRVFEQLNRIMGINTFDKSASGLRLIAKETAELSRVNELMARGMSMSKKEVVLLARDIEALTQRMQAEGASVDALAAAKENLIQKFNATAKLHAAEVLKSEQREKQAREEAAAVVAAEQQKANAVRQTMAVMMLRQQMLEKQEEVTRRIELQAKYLKEGIGSSAAGKAADLEMSGFDDATIQRYIAATKNLSDVQASLKTRTDTVSVSTSKLSTEKKQAASAAEWLRLTEERLQTQLNETDKVMRKQYTDTLVKLRQQMRAAGYDAKKTEVEFARLEKMVRGVASKENTRNLDNLARAVSVQMGDVAVSLATGMNPLLVMIQQGDQIRGAIQMAGAEGAVLQNTMMTAAKQIATSFTATGKAFGMFFTGAIVSSGEAVTSLVTKMLGLNKMMIGWEVAAAISSKAGNNLVGSLLRITKAAVGLTSVGIGVALASLAIGAFQAMRENDKLARSLALTNGALGITHNQAFAAAAAFEAAGGHAGKFIQVISAAGKAAELTANQVNMIAQSVIDLDTYGGVAIEDTVKKFSDLQKDPVDALIKLQKETGMVSRALFEQVEALVVVGREYEAGQLAVQEYTRISNEQVDQIKGSYTGLGLFVTNVLAGMGNAWDKFVKGVWRKDTSGDAALDLLQERLALLEPEVGFGKAFLSSEQKAEIESLREQIRLQKSLVTQREIDAESRREQDILAQEAMRERLKGLSQEERHLNKIQEYAFKITKANTDVDRETFRTLMMKEYKALEDMKKKVATGSGGVDPFKAALDTYEDLINAAEGLNRTYNNQVGRLNFLKTSGKFIAMFKSEAEAIDAVNKAMRILEEQQPAFKEAEERRKKSINDTVKAFMNYEETIASINDELKAYTEANDRMFVDLQTEAALIGVSASEREKVVKLLAAEAKYKNIVANINKKLADGEPEKQEKLDVALREYQREVQGVLSDVHLKAAKEYSDYLAEMSRGLAEATYIALTEGHRKGAAALRDLITNALRKRFVITVDAYINEVLNRGVDMLLGNGGKGSGASALSDGSALSNLYGAISGYFNRGTDSFNSWEQDYARMQSGSSGSSMGGGWVAAIAAAMTKSWNDVREGWNRDALMYSANNGSGISGTAAFRTGAKHTAERSRLFENLGMSRNMADFLSAAPVLTKLFGHKAPVSQAAGLQGSFSNGQFSGSQYSQMFAEGGIFRSDRSWDNTANLDASTTQLFTSAYDATRAAVREMANELGIGTDALDSFTHEFRLNMQGLTEEEQLKLLNEEFDKLSDAMVSNLFNVSEYRRVGETATETMLRLSSTLKAVNNAFEVLGWQVNETSMAGYAAADSFAAMFGGIEQAASALATYYDKFYTEEEKVTNRVEQVARAFAEMGLVMPQTISDFRALVDATQASGNTERLTDILKIAGDFASMLEEQTAAFQTYYDLQKQLYQLTGDVNALRELELVELDATAQEIQKQIWLLSDLQEAQKQFSASLQELERNYADAQAATRDAEEEVRSIREKATSEYVKATERVADATARMADIQEELRNTYAETAKSLREFIAGQMGASVGGSGFSALIDQAKAGDLDAAGKLGSSAEQEIARAYAKATTAEEARMGKLRILEQVAQVAAVMEGYNGSSLEEQILASNKDMIEAQAELTNANLAVADALAVVTTIGASLVEIPQDLVAEFNAAINRLADAQTFENAMLAALNSIKDVSETIATNTDNLSPALQLFAQKVLTDVITTVNVVATSNLPDDLRALALAGNAVLERTVKFIVEDSELSEDDRKMLLEQTSAVSKTFNLIANSAGLTDSEKEVLLNATSSAARLVEINAQLSDTLTDTEREILAQSNEVVTKVVKQVIDSGVLTDDQRALLATVTGTVNRITELGIDDSGLSEEQRALFNLLSQANDSASIAVGGSVSWTFDEIIAEVLNRIADATEETVEVLNSHPNAYGPSPPPGFVPPTYDENGWLVIDGGSTVPIQPFADGGVFTNGIVDRPTRFSIAGMGEAGAEAIMPLTRTSDGSLGVSASSSSSDEMLEELRRLNRKVEELEAAARSTAITNNKIAKVLDRVSPDGESLQVVTVT